MGLHKGQTNNINGRPKGSENKSTDKLRNTVLTFIENNIEGMQANFDQLEVKDKLMFLEKMLSYSLPRLQATQLKVETDIFEPIKGITFDKEETI
jgi:hypothetical protein